MLIKFDLFSERKEYKEGKGKRKRKLQVTKNKRIASLVEGELIFEQYLEILYLTWKVFFIFFVR